MSRIYFRVTGAAATTAAYVVTLGRTAVSIAPSHDCAEPTGGEQWFAARSLARRGRG